MLDPNFLKA